MDLFLGAFRKITKSDC